MAAKKNKAKKMKQSDACSKCGAVDPGDVYVYGMSFLSTENGKRICRDRDACARHSNDARIGYSHPVPRAGAVVSKLSQLSISRRFEFDAGHRLMQHAGKCKNYHGHRYVVELHVTSPETTDGMVVDFGLVKQIVGEWLDNHWDHVMILQFGDPLCDVLLRMGMRVSFMDKPPTVENLSELFAATAAALLFGREETKLLRISKVEMWETPNCKAVFIP